jgi:prepilin-type N-terminal cleavage/methylation domain-containing protein
MMRRRDVGNTRGFTLIEVLISLVIFAIALLSLGRTTLIMGRQSSESTLLVYRNAEMAKQVNRLAALEWDSLPSRAGCVTKTTAPFPHQRCVTLTTVSSRQTQVQIVITPTVTLLRPDTTVFDRVNEDGVNPFSGP